MSRNRFLASLLALLLTGCTLGGSRPAADNLAGLTITEELSPLRTGSPLDQQWEALQQLGQAPAPRPDDRITRANERLAPFGYRLVERPERRFDLYQGESLLAGGLELIRPPSVSASGTAFVMEVGGIDHTQLLGPDGLRDWERPLGYVAAPVYAGDRLISLGYDDVSVIVLADGQEVYRTTVQADGNYPVQRLTTWQGEWVLELTDDRIIVESKPLPYDAAFGWSMLGGKPFHFYRKGKRYGIRYDGQEGPAIYQEIIHNACCEPSMYNPYLSAEPIHFYAFAKGGWRRVLIQSEVKTGN